MEKVFTRNFLIFAAVVIIGAAVLSINLIRGNQEIATTSDRVVITYSIINEAEELNGLVEKMLASQRGYLLTGDEEFLESYQETKMSASNHTATLSELTPDNPSQQSRLDELRSYFTQLSTKLEERAQKLDVETIQGDLNDVNVVNNIKDNIIQLNKAILNEEYGILNARIRELESRKNNYFYTLLIGIVVSAALLLIFNGFLLSAQRKRTKIEDVLQVTKDRLSLAIEGTDDGIFDWDLEKGNVFYSARYFSMLGYEHKDVEGTTKEFEDLIHEDDIKGVWEAVENYVSGKISEYNIEFRMKNKAGRWVWINAKAKAIFDKKGRAVRMVGAHSDITHMKKENEALKSEKEEAIEANKAKSDFLAHMSHEIRTPLTAISGIAKIMERRKDNLDDKQKKLVHTLNESTSALKDLINDILDFSKIESREIELSEDFFAFDHLVEQVISMMSVRASEKGISFVFKYDDIDDFVYYGDQTRIRQILVNLISNAIKFTEKGGVTVNAELEERDAGQFLRIDVSDTGIGIDPENFDLVFEKFKQADASVSRRFGGTGLGLPISRNLAQLMGGDIFISSESGKGSTFSLLLPVKDEQGKAQPSNIEDITQKLNEQIRNRLNNKAKLLLVEDYEGNVVMLSYMLDDLGFDYDVANTGKEALALWEEHHYDIILMDIQMPEMDGFAATKEIRNLEKMKKLHRTPIIGMTAHALVGDKDNCIQAGMDAYLPKPIVESDLKREILNFIDDNKKKEKAV